MSIFLLTVSFLVLFVAVGLPLIIEKELSNKIIFVSLFIVFPVLGLFLWIWFGTFYTIDNDVLKAKSGPFFWRIKVREINKIKVNQPTVVGIIKLTLSFRSMEVIYKKYNSIFICPKDQDEFLEDLKMINTSIEVS